MCYRNAGIGKAANASGYAGNDAQSYAVLDQCLRFFTATAKDKRVAALQAQHALVLACQFDQPQRNIALVWRRFSAPLASIFDLGIRPGPAQKRRIDQSVINDNICLLQGIERVQRD